MVEGGIPVYFDSGGHDLIGIVMGSDGALWFTNGSDPGSIGRIMTSGVLTFFDAPRISEPDWIAAGPDGVLWFTNESSGMYATPPVTFLRHWRP